MYKANHGAVNINTLIAVSYKAIKIPFHGNKYLSLAKEFD